MKCQFILLVGRRVRYGYGPLGRHQFGELNLVEVSFEQRRTPEIAIEESVHILKFFLHFRGKRIEILGEKESRSRVSLKFVA